MVVYNTNFQHKNQYKKHIGISILCNPNSNPNPNSNSNPITSTNLDKNYQNKIKVLTAHSNKKENKLSPAHGGRDKYIQTPSNADDE